MMNTNIQPSDAALFINGLFFDMEYEDIFNILETLKAEGKVLDGLGELGMTYCIFVRRSNVHFWFLFCQE